MRKPISAGDLSRLGSCETRMVLDRAHGEVVSEEQKERREEGRRAHADFDRDVQANHNRAKVRKGPCFIASAVYGADAWQTDALRDFRDRALMPSSVGRGLVWMYYRSSPPLARALSGRPRAKLLVRAVLDRIVLKVAGRTPACGSQGRGSN